MEKDQIISDFRKHLETIGYRLNYIQILKNYLVFCENNNIDIYNIDYKNLSDYIYHIRVERKNNNGSTNMHMKGVKFFYKYLHLNDKVNDQVINHTSKLTLLKEEFKIRESITLKELDRIIQCAVNYSFPMSYLKIKGVLYFMFYSGVRPKELMDMKRSEINIKDCYAYVRVPSKTKRERKVFFPRKLSNILKDFFITEPEENNAFNLTEGKLWAFFSFLKNFNKKISPYTMRRSFTHNIMKNGVDIRIAQRLLGHASINSTLRYYNPDEEMIEQVYRKKIK